MNRRASSPEYLEPGSGTGRIRLVGAANGTYAGQVVVGTDRELAGVRIVTGALKPVKGSAAIPAAAVRVLGMAGHPVAKMSRVLGQGRIPIFRCAVTGRVPPPVEQALIRFADDVAGDDGSRKDAARRILYFDEITDRLPETVPADSCRPYWISVEVPGDTPPGRYRGVVRVLIPGSQPVEVPVELDVVAWCLPDPVDFQADMAVEQSPYAVARQYGVRLWSPAHWKLVEASVAELARVGNDWWFVPVLLRTEFGNLDDSMIGWYRMEDGELGFDYRVLDRYLDIVTRHCGRPKVVSFVVMHGTPKSPIEVLVYDAATGKPSRVCLGGPGADPAVRQNYWTAFANALYRHMSARGLGSAMHWGYAWDTEGDPKLKGLLAGVLPDVRWTSGSHNTKRGGSGGGGRLDTSYYRSTSEIYSMPLSARSRKGWKQPEIRLNTPRAESTCACIEGHSTPFGYRLAVDRAVAAGFSGLGRIGGDYWADTYWHGMRGSEYHMAGFPVLTVLWPGPNGARPGVRFEALVEGLQETEARIFIEQAIDRGLVPDGLAERAGEVLFRHNAETLSLPTHVPANWMNENAQGWFCRSQRLYRMAAEVAGVVGLDVGSTVVRKNVAPYTRPKVDIILRNWTGKPRAWTAATSEKWLVCEADKGTATGFQRLAVRIDAAQLPANRTSVGTMTVTDVPSGRSQDVSFEVSVGKVFDFPSRIVINALPGKRHTREGLALYNNSAVELAYKVGSGADWLKVTPASGKVGPRRIARLRLLVDVPRPPGKHRASIELSAGGVTRQSEVIAYAVPTYRQPEIPAGESVWLLDAVRSKVVKTKSHVCVGIDPAEVRKMPREKRPHLSWWMKRPMYNGHNIPGGAREHRVYGRDRNLVPFPMGGRTFQRGYWAFPAGRTTYDIEGADFTAFSAWVGFNRGMEKGYHMANRAAVCNCEIYVDGKLRTQSGLFKVGDKPRLIVVAGLAEAKQLTLVTRTRSAENDRRVVVTWGNPRFHKK
jgi:hypothetical protein